MATNYSRAVHRWDGVVSRLLGAACVRHGARVDYPRMTADYNRIAAEQISERTLRRRMDEPGSISLEELYLLSKSLGLTLEIKLEEKS